MGDLVIAFLAILVSIAAQQTKPATAPRVVIRGGESVLVLPKAMADALAVAFGLRDAHLQEELVSRVGTAGVVCGGGGFQR